MRPVSLTLTGFCGIRAGLGRETLRIDLHALPEDAHLVAIAGANGRGKSTLMDNLHPYLCLPSRGGMGGSAYYDHVYLPESEKDLVWEHAGQRYRSQVVIRLNGRRRTEAYLWQDVAGRWQPLELADGTRSDGKLETYQRCVEAVCGRAETFFTAMFSAQGKRPLSDYRNADIKTLLADLLGLAQLRTLGEQARDTARLLKAGLQVLQHEQAAAGDAAQRVATQRHALAGSTARVTACRAECAAARRVCEQARADLLARRQDEAHWQHLQGRRAALLQAIDTLATAQAQAERQRLRQQQDEAACLQRLQQRVAARQAHQQQQCQHWQRQRRQAQSLLQQAGVVELAEQRQARAEQVLAARERRWRDARQRLEGQYAEQHAQAVCQQRLASVEREAGQAALRAHELTQRGQLMGRVPCVGTDLQGRCALLCEARAAQARIPDSAADLARLAQEQTALQQAVVEGQVRVDAGAAVAADVIAAEARVQRARQRSGRFAQRAALSAELSRARQTLREAETALRQPALMVVGETADEQAERAQLRAAQAEREEQQAVQAQHYRQQRERLQAELASVPDGDGAVRRADAEAALQAASAAMDAAEQTLAAALLDAQQAAALDEQARQLRDALRQRAGRMAQVGTTLSQWQVFARCMSPDGLIALAIDDAGPTLAGLTNALLTACYGPRFSVTIHTQVSTAQGGLREGFDIQVQDAESGQSRPVGVMSGGERIWINECLVRAVALYLAEQGGWQYDTVFSDEADGALDADRKRMFMAMKREVLRLGGYQREYFISQTPELTAMADAVIDLEAWAVQDNPGALRRPNSACG